MTPSKQKMRFDLVEALEALEATPRTLSSYLAALSDSWLDFSEDTDAWSPRRVLIHLIHNEQTNWLPRARVILSEGTGKTFAPFHQMPEEGAFAPREMDQLLDQFAQLRRDNLSEMRGFGLKANDLDREGKHPALGTVTLRQLIATWVVHDLNHLHQIAKSLAKRYSDAVGPWRANLAILDL